MAISVGEVEALIRAAVKYGALHDKAVTDKTPDSRSKMLDAEISLLEEAQKFYAKQPKEKNVRNTRSR